MDKNLLTDSDNLYEIALRLRKAQLDVFELAELILFCKTSSNSSAYTKGRNAGYIHGYRDGIDDCLTNYDV